MNENRSHLEANLARMIKAAAGGEAQLKESQRERTWHRLIAESRRSRPASPFPDRVLAFLGGVQAFAALWLGIRVLTNGFTGTIDVPSLFVALPVTVNLACLPIAVMLIYRRRRSHVQTA